MRSSSDEPSALGSVKRSLYSDLLHAFLKERETLRKAGWVVSDQESPAWWDDLRSPHEIAIAAVLVQLNSWEKVKEAVVHLRERGLADLRALSGLSVERIDSLISGINFHRSKAERLKRLAELYLEKGDELFKQYETLRSIKGIGEETARAITLFAGNVMTVPPSDYLSRVLSRVLGVKLTKEEASKEVLRALGSLFELKLFYAGITTVGKLFCKPRPRCEKCIIRAYCNYADEALRVGGEAAAGVAGGQSS